MNPSEKQIAANRRNAQRSTGPKTIQGKAIASRNSLKHGLLAKEVVITEGENPESREEFDNVLSDLTEQFSPQGALEEILVEKIAVAYWRLRRAHRYEVGLLRRNMDNAVKNYYKWDSYNALDPKRTDDQIDEDIRQIKQEITKWRNDKEVFTELYEGKADLSDINCELYSLNWKYLAKQFKVSLMSTADNSPESIREALNQAGWSDDDIWKFHIENCDEMVRFYTQNIEELQKEKEDNKLALQVQKKLHSIPDARNLARLLKYEGSIEKQFYKAISELERLQRMRRGEALPAPFKIDLDVNNTDNTE